MGALKRWFRALVVVTSRPPIDAMYLGAYRLATQLATAVLGRCPGVVAVYLTRGYAKDQILPGVSDIDLIVVTENEQGVAGARRACHALNRISCGLIEYYPAMVMPAEQMRYRWRHIPIWQYRLAEGLVSWRLIIGKEVRGDWEPLPESQRRTADWQELGRWWIAFADAHLGPGAARTDYITGNVACYKAVTETRNVVHALLSGERRPSREAALAGDYSSLAARLRAIRESHFLSRDRELPDLTFRFLVGQLTEFWTTFSARPFVAVHPGVNQAVDTDGLVADAAETELLKTLRRHLDSWGPACRGLHIVSSAYFDLDDRLLLVDLDPCHLPDVRRIAELSAAVVNFSTGKSARRFLAYLHLGGLAFPLTPLPFRDLHRGLLSPATVPDVFLQLGYSEVYWTTQTAWYICDHSDNEMWRHAPPEKHEQLDLIAASAARGSVVYPLDRVAIERERSRRP
jgi:hypothetical protein